MKSAMILAAGRGERMRPLTDATPKPLLRIASKPIIDYHVERLVKAGYENIVVNSNHLESQIQNHLGTGDKFSTKIQFSSEQPNALETGGGIFQALSQLGDELFCVINGDIYCDHDLQIPMLEANVMAHLLLVENPPHNIDGDFGIRDGFINNSQQNKWTFSGIGWYHPELFEGCAAGKFPLAPLLRKAADKGRVSGDIHKGMWMDIGTPERLAEINTILGG